MSARLLLSDAIPAATLSAAGTVAGMGADKLKTDPKGEACRITGSSATLVATWASAQTIGVVILPACSLGPSSQIRIQAFADIAGTELLEDSDWQWAVPGANLGNWDFSQPLNQHSWPNVASANDFSTGAPTVASYFRQHHAAQRLEVQLQDPGAAFIDVSRLVAGPFLQCRYNASYGASAGVIDLSSNTRSEAGDIKTDWAPRARRLAFNLEFVPDHQRASIYDLLKAGIGRWVFADLCYGRADTRCRQDLMLYGKLTQPGSMAWAMHGYHSTQFDIEGY